ncbi:unnamed protein product [Paramecium sonneborni]|uniref:Transmembrane protein n=1 Tax=Paramecium sonneborni TaxID=65129 RepID=A0A8S1RP11_9CILI|nr:unnamed protein product [Paramecium sonneborni]
MISNQDVTSILSEQVIHTEKIQECEGFTPNKNYDKMLIKKKFQFIFDNHKKKIFYILDGRIFRCDYCEPFEIMMNFEQIMYLNWKGDWKQNQKKNGKFRMKSDCFLFNGNTHLQKSLFEKTLIKGLNIIILGKINEYNFRYFQCFFHLYDSLQWLYLISIVFILINATQKISQDQYFFNQYFFCSVFILFSFNTNNQKKQRNLIFLIILRLFLKFNKFKDVTDIIQIILIFVLQLKLQKTKILIIVLIIQNKVDQLLDFF